MTIVTHQIQNYELPVIALQEVRWPEDGSVKSKNHTIYYRGSIDGIHEHGVSFMVSDLILPNVKDFTLINYRLYVLKLEGHFWDIVLLHCYASVLKKETITSNGNSMKIRREYMTPLLKGKILNKYGL